MQLTDRRVYFTWEDVRRRDDVPLFKENALVPSSPVTPSLAEQLGEPWPWADLDFGRLDVRSPRVPTQVVVLPDPQDGISVGCIDFSLMPES